MKAIQKTMTKTKTKIGCQEQHWCTLHSGYNFTVDQWMREH